MTLGLALATLVPLACSGDDKGATPTSATAGPNSSAAGAPTSTSATGPGSTDTPGASTSVAPGTTTADTAVLDTLDTAPLPEDTDPPAQEKLPADGPATVAGIALPAGKVLVSSDTRLAWITDDKVPGTAAIWQKLWAAAPSTGLYPVMVRDDDQQPGWEAQQFFPNQPGEIDKMKLEDVLTNSAQINFTPPREFKGLAPASSGPEDVAAAEALVAALPDAKIALVESRRGADALSFMGWTGNATYDVAEAVAVAVRSWEERYGARVVVVGPNSLTLVITKPPATSAEAAALSQELVLIDPDLEVPGAVIPTVALNDGLLGQHQWTFWWQ
jgi:hypothetical protein